MSDIANVTENNTGVQSLDFGTAHCVLLEAVDGKLEKESLGFGALQCCRVVVSDQETEGGPVGGEASFGEDNLI